MEDRQIEHHQIGVGPGLGLPVLLPHRRFLFWQAMTITEWVKLSLLFFCRRPFVPSPRRADG
jgi:hypothetical protein